MADTERKVILDGNNVLRALNIVRGSDVSAAERFLQSLERIAALRDWEVIVAFEGPKRFLPRESGPLVIRYAPPGKTADSLIERLVYEEPDRSCVVVVTEDLAERNLVMGLGARVWSPQRLMEELTRQG